MCGIQGIYRSQNQNKRVENYFSESFISARGPDAKGFWSSESGRIDLIHTRLSIIDSSSNGRQPMHDESCDWVISYNGEIFNYIEIRDELRGLGWSFRSESDTEVLLKAWAQWGVDSLNRLNGMFAFAIVHRFSGEMWLVRDRFGVKPLLWGLSDNGDVIFSSSTAAVADALKAQVNVDYCAFGLRYKAFELSDGRSAFHGVNALPPGSWLRVRMMNSEIVLDDGHWYDLSSAVERKRAAISIISEVELLEECQNLLQDAVRIRLRSDVPLAVSLSGGLDSSSVAGMAAKVVGDLHGFTYGAADAMQSEGPVVARFAQHAGIKAHFIWPSLDAGGLDALLERTLSWQEAPFPGLSVMAQNEIFRAVSDAGFKVLLGGQGGDEIFAGYRKFFVVAARHALKKRDVVDSVRLLYSLGLMLLNEAGAARTYWRALGRYSSKHDCDFSLLNWTPELANLWGSEGGSLVDRQIDDVQRWSIPTLLRYEDRNSMGHGVESRLPFMDYRLVELALALPTRMKIANGFGKWAVREIMDGVVPDFVRLNRKKRGFDVTQNWIADGLGLSLRSRLLENREILSPYLKAGLDIEAYLSDSALQRSSNLLDEALMLAWLVQPIRNRSHEVIGA